MTVNTIYRGVQGNSSAQFALGDAFTTAQNNDDSLNLTKSEYVTNVAALRLLDKTKINNAATKGYYTAGDGGHGQYWYDSADTTSPDNGFTVIVANDGGRWRLLLEQGSANILQAGAKRDGITDNSTSIQTALNSGLLSLVIPDGEFVADNLLMPATFGFVLCGKGVSSKLKQKSSVNPLVRWSTASINYTEGYIKDLTFIGTNGGNNTINTSGVGGLTLKDLYFNNIPTGYSSIYIDGASGVDVHDIRLDNIQIYTNTAGHSGIRLSEYTADTIINNFIMNGNFIADYCLHANSGAKTLQMKNCHPYNAKINIMKLAGTNSDCMFNGVTFDNSLEDLVRIEDGNSRNSFTGCYFEAVNATKSAVVIVDSFNTSFYNTIFQAQVGSASCVKEVGTSRNTQIVGGSLGTAASFTTPFDLIGSQSYATGLNGYNPQGLEYFLAGATTAAQAQNTTQYLGVNGGNSNINATAFVVPYDSILGSAFIAVTSTPAVGQTFTFNVKQGVTTVGTGVISNGSFSVTINVNTTVSKYNQISIESIFSATSGSAFVRYVLNIKS